MRAVVIVVIMVVVIILPSFVVVSVSGGKQMNESSEIQYFDKFFLGGLKSVLVYTFLVILVVLRKLMCATLLRRGKFTTVI